MALGQRSGAGEFGIDRRRIVSIGTVARMIWRLIRTPTAESYESTMPMGNLESMDFENLWKLHEKLTKVLAEKITAEKLELDKRLALLNRSQGGDPFAGAVSDARTGPAPPNKYPKVPPKYRNTAAPYEMWSGRGKRPRWLTKAVQAGHEIEEYRLRKDGEAAGSNELARGNINSATPLKS